MRLPFKRADRVGDLIREELSRLLLREVKDPRLASLTVTRVAVSDDLRVARVYVAVATEGEARSRQLAGLRSAAGFLRGRLARNLRLRFAPELSFLADEGLEHGLHIAALLKELAPAEEEPDE